MAARPRSLLSNGLYFFSPLFRSVSLWGAALVQVLQNSVIEHNLLAASKIYQNIRFDQLGFLLGIRPAEVGG